MNQAAPRMLIATTVCETIECFLLPFAEHYRKLGWTVDALASGVEKSPAVRSAFDAAWEASWTRSPLNLAGNRRAAESIRELVRRREYDIVHVHTPVASFVTRSALRRERGKFAVVYTAHGFHFFKGAPAHKNIAFLNLEKLAGRWTDCLVVINREDFNAARQHGIVPDRCLHYMPGIGVDLARYDPEAVPKRLTKALRDELAIEDDETTFLCIGEMIPRKRHQDLLKAFALVPGPCKLLMAGNGPLLPALQKLAKDLGVDSRVRFLGVRRDIPAVLSVADAVVLLSSQEGLPRSVLEAMAMGKPVIGTSIRGNRELLEDGAGLLVPIGDIAEIARCMDLVRTAPQVGRAIGERARCKVRAYDLRQVIALHDDLYNRFLAAPKVISVDARDACASPSYR